METWKVVECSPEYEVSDLGRVRRVSAAAGTYAGRILAQPRSKNGYPQVNIRRDGRIRSTKVHILVATAFHGPKPSPVHQVAHRDGDRTNNRVDNLRWALPAENAHDNILNGVQPQGEAHPRAKMSEDGIRDIRLRHAALIKELASEYGLGLSQVRTIIKGERWTNVHAHSPD